MSDLKSFGSKNNIINTLFVNGRHVGLSVILTSQYYTCIPSATRSNATCVVVFPTSDKELDKISYEHSPCDCATFKSKIKQNQREAYDFCMIDYSKPSGERFKNSLFQTIEMID
jgi:Poxvirus A32 protein.